METNTNPENAKLIEEMLLEVKSVPRTAEVIHQGDAAQPAPMVMTVQDEGLCIIYESTTGEPVTCLRYMLSTLLQAKNKDGSRRFVTSTSKIPYRGSLKCLLHAENPERQHYNELGLPVCRKSNLTAPYMIEQHMKRRHPTAWAIIERERMDVEKEEQRQYDRGLLSSIVKAANKNK